MEYIIISLIIAWFVYEYLYYRSDKFIKLRDSIKEHTNNCNELNEHIEKLKKSYVEIKQIDYGKAEYTDKSLYNFKRPELKKARETKNKNVFECSSTVCNGARQQPFKYLCKYFDLKANEETLTNFENVLNNFSAAEQGKVLLKNERDTIVKSISSEIPVLIKLLSKRKLIKKLGFTNIDFSQFYFPRYSFKYVSAGGNSSMEYVIILDIENLNKFVEYLSRVIKLKNSVEGQRALMTSLLREKIKSRDNYTCQNCGLSINAEQNLLLEIDHIIPLSKNGLTTEENLQTLCWKCNRSKGAKIL